MRITLKRDRELGSPSQCEFTVVKSEAYDAISAYLAELGNTNIRSLEDIIEFNRENTGTEGANPGDHPAFASGQVRFLKPYTDFQKLKSSGPVRKNC